LKSGLTTSVFGLCVEGGYAPDFFLHRSARRYEAPQSVHQVSATLVLEDDGSDLSGTIFKNSKLRIPKS
jgi:hypothetical protein